jgi:hypothetical protein
MRTCAVEGNNSSTPRFGETVGRTVPADRPLTKVKGTNELDERLRVKIEMNLKNVQKMGKNEMTFRSVAEIVCLGDDSWKIKQNVHTWSSWIQVSRRPVHF